MSKFIDADRLKKEIEKERKKALDSTKRGGLTISDIATADVLAEVLLIIEQLQKEQPAPEELPPVVPLTKFPTLRLSIEEQLYKQVVRKLPGCPPHAGIRVDLILRPSTVQKLKKDYEQNGSPATAEGTVQTDCTPKNLIVSSVQWDDLLAQFDNGQRVRVILVKEDEK